MTKPSDTSERRRAENEVVFKQRNDRIQRQLTALFDKSTRQELVVSYVCECSNENCRDTVDLTAASYANLRHNSRQFIILPEHQQSDIERVIKHANDYMVVEKYQTPPPTNGKLNVTH